MGQTQQDEAGVPLESPTPRRPARTRLYAPFLILALAALGWSVAWLVIRGRVVGGLDEWLAAEAASGRTWTCPGRTVGGFPFRLELRCASLNFQRPDAVADLGALVIVAQVYDWNRLIAEVSGPFHVKAGGTEAVSTWRLLQASVVLSAGRLQRLAIAADDPTTRIIYPDATTLDLRSGHVEVHARPNPTNSASVDLALGATASVIPGLDALIGATEPGDLQIVATVTQAYDLPARPLWGELERWRAAAGKVEITQASFTSGQRRVALSGSLGIDDLHRPQGDLQASSRNLGGLVGKFTGGSGVGRLLGALAGGGKRQTPAGVPDPAQPPLDPLPPLRVENGRLSVGPFQIPGIRIPALY